MRNADYRHCTLLSMVAQTPPRIGRIYAGSSPEMRV